LIGASLVHVYRALESSDDYGEFHDALNHALERGRAALHLLGQVDTDDGAAARELVALGQIVRDLRRVEYESGESPGGAGKAAPPPRIQRASIRVPTLVEFGRARIFPVVPLPPPPEPEATEASVDDPPAETAPDLDALLASALAAAEEVDRDDDGDRAEEAQATRSAPLGPAVDEELEREYVGTQLTELDVLGERARVFFEELASFGAMRRPMPDQTWTGREKPERRLLARVDAIIACGGWVLPGLVKLLEDRPLPDPDMTWAAVFLFGSIAGDDALDQAVRVARAAPLDVESVHLAVIDALAHAPNPKIPDIMRGWLDDPDGATRSIAVAVLSRRRKISLPEALRATHDPDERVVTAGASAIGVTDGTVTPVEFEALLHDERPGVVSAALTSAVLRRVQGAPLRAIELVRERPDFGDAAAIAAVAGPVGPTLDALRTALSARVTPALTRAIGWFGHSTLVDALLEQLGGDDAAVQAAAVEALQRITGAALTDDNPEPAYPPNEQPFVHEYRAPSPVASLSADPHVWSTWWTEYGKHADASARYRFGHRWGVRDGLWELETPESPRADRWLAYLELVARTGETLPFDANEFVWRQREQLRSWRDRLAGRLTAAAPDGWAVHTAR
jgi:HEAT repeat protein